MFLSCCILSTALPTGDLLSNRKLLNKLAPDFPFTSPTLKYFVRFCKCISFVGAYCIFISHNRSAKVSVSFSFSSYLTSFATGASLSYKPLILFFLLSSTKGLPSSSSLYKESGLGMSLSIELLCHFDAYLLETVY